MKILVVLLMLAASVATATPEDAILRVMRDAEAGWNAGDLEVYMQGYWNSPELRFAGGGTVTTGWQATLDRYRARYTDRAIMGTLVFSDLEVTVLADDAATVFGRWKLVREDDEPHGLFTLVMRRFDEGWRIVHDHTSPATP